MEKILGKESEDFKAFGMIWKLYQAYYIPEQNDEYWEKLINDGNKLVKQFPNTPIVRAFVSAFINTLEREMKDGRTV